MPSLAVGEDTHRSVPWVPPGALDDPRGAGRDPLAGHDGHGGVDLVLRAEEVAVLRLFAKCRVRGEGDGVDEGEEVAHEWGDKASQSQEEQA